MDINFYNDESSEYIQELNVHLENKNVYQLANDNSAAPLDSKILNLNESLASVKSKCITHNLRMLNLKSLYFQIQTSNHKQSIIGKLYICITCNINIITDHELNITGKQKNNFITNCKLSNQKENNIIDAKIIDSDSKIIKTNSSSIKNIPANNSELVSNSQLTTSQLNYLNDIEINSTYTTDIENVNCSESELLKSCLKNVDNIISKSDEQIENKLQNNTISVQSRRKAKLIVKPEINLNENKLSFTVGLSNKNKNASKNIKYRLNKKLKNSCTKSKHDNIITKPFQCITCNRKYITKNGLKRHICKYKTFNCTKCDKTFTNNTFYRYHYLAKHEKIFKYFCAHCKKAYCVKNDIRRHIVSVHLKLKEYTCEICGKSYSTDAILYIHRKTHDFSTQVKCNLCGFILKTQRNLDRHLKLHYNVRNNYQCDLCDKKIYIKKSLEIHMLQHLNITPFKCNPCKKSYSAKSSYIYHIKTIHGGYTRADLRRKITISLPSKRTLI